MENIHIAIVGEQPMPIIIPVFQYLPNTLTLICTEETAKYAAYIKSALALDERTRQIRLNIYEPFVSPHDPNDTDTAVKKTLDLYRDARAAVNITGGTKIMSTAATIRARQYNADIIYVISQKKGVILHWSENEQISRDDILVNIPIDVRFACHGLTAVNGEEWDERHQKIAKMFARLAVNNPNQHLTYRLAKNVTGSALHNEVVIPNTAAKEKEIAISIAKMGYWKINTADHGKIRIKIPDDPKVREFISGKWLEAYAYTVCKESGLFDQCWSNVKINRENMVENELDLVVCKNEDMAICSCKTSMPSTGDANKAIYELDSVASPDLAGRFCGKILITTARQLSENAMRRAENKIKMLTQVALPNLAQNIANALKNC